MTKAKRSPRTKPEVPQPAKVSIENWPVAEGHRMDFFGSWAVARTGSEFYGQALVYLHHQWPHIYHFSNGKISKESVSAIRDDGLAYSAPFEKIEVLEGREYRRYAGRNGLGGFVVMLPALSVK